MTSKMLEQQWFIVTYIDPMAPGQHQQESVVATTPKAAREIVETGRFNGKRLKVSSVRSATGGRTDVTNKAR